MSPSQAERNLLFSETERLSIMRFRAYRQLENSDCGITCIRMIARHYGKSIPLKHLRSLADISKLGISVKDIIDGFHSIRMEAAAVRISIDDIYRMPCPAIIYWQQRHFVVVYDINPKKKVFHIADPADGKMRFTEKEFCEYWLNGNDRGIAVVAEPMDDFDNQRFEETNTIKGLFNLVWKELTGHKPAFIKIILLSLICMGADLLSPLLLQQTVDEGIALRDISLVWMLVLGQLAVFLGNAASSNFLEYLLIKLSLSLNLEMLRKYLGRLIGFPLSFFDRKAPSELIQKVDDQSRIKDFLLQIPQTTFFMVLNLLVFSGLLIYYNPFIFLFFLGMTLAEVAWTVLFLRPRRGIDYAFFTNAAENRNHIYELVNGMTEIKTNNAQNAKIGKWEKTQKKINRLSLKSTLMNMGMNGGQNLIARLKEITITGICATLVIQDQLTIGAMMTVSYIVGRLSSPFRSLISTIGSVQDAAISYERLDEVLNDDTEPNGNAKYTAPLIEFRNVSFKYPGSSSPFVIDDLSLLIEPGKTTAIVGESGCGKTTLIKLMLGFYIPQCGSLRLSGTDVATLDRDDWLRHCGVVMQSGYIFSDTIKANVSLADDDADLRRVKEAIETAGLTEFIEKLPMGYNTRIGPTGMELSGGQKQRLLIARAVYRHPDILFLDEATSSLDATNERAITERLLRLHQGKTLIIAAHRLSTVKNADRILFMKEGRITESGTHAELVALGGEYFRLVSNQLELSV